MTVVLAIVGILALICVAYYLIETKFPNLGDSIKNRIGSFFGLFKKKDKKVEKEEI